MLIEGVGVFLFFPFGGAPIKVGAQGKMFPLSPSIVALFPSKSNQKAAIFLQITLGRHLFYHSYFGIEYLISRELRIPTIYTKWSNIDCIFKMLAIDISYTHLPYKYDLKLSGNSSFRAFHHDQAREYLMGNTYQSYT